MLTGRHLVFVGGDARQLEVISYVTDLDASVRLIGFDALDRQFPDTEFSDLSDGTLGWADAVVLPIAGMGDDGLIDSPFSTTPIQLMPEQFAELRAHTHVFTGIARPVLDSLCRSHNLQLVKLMELDEVAILNSIPTAEGAIGLAMQHTDITIHGSRTAVLGFGRCGLTLARTLAALGAKVRVCARQRSDLARAHEMGFQPFPIAELEDATRDADVVFNTIPHPVLTASVLMNIPRECVIIDIASRPGGTDFRYAERRGIKAILAPSLPGLVAPKTAGRIVAQSLSRILADSTS